jgi:hypothetical protein
VAESRRDAMLDDVRRLLAADGLAGVPVFGVSARHRIGIDVLREEIVKRVADKKMARTRLEADLRSAATELAAESGTAAPATLSKERITALEDAFAEAAGVPTVVAAVAQSTRLRAGRATGWPVVSWVTRLKPDPLKRLHLDLGAAGKELTGRARTSVPAPTQVQRARVDTEVRAVADEVSTGLARPWAHAIRAASTARLDDLGDRLDAALAGTDLGVQRMPVWAGLVRVLQWLLILSAVGGAGWLGALAVMSYVRLPEPATPAYQGVPVPTIMLVGGVALGIALAMLCRIVVSVTARRRASAADRRLRAAIAAVSQELVVAPIEAELAAYSRVRNGLTRALA